MFTYRLIQTPPHAGIRKSARAQARGSSSPALGLLLALFLATLHRSTLGDEARTATRHDIAGNWSGTIDLPAQALQVQVSIQRTDSGLKGAITIPAQNARDLPLTDMTLENAQWTCRLPDAPGNASFTAELSDNGNELVGTLSQAGGEFPIKLIRGVSTTDLVAKLAGFDLWLDETVKKWGAPGVAVGIVMNDEIIFCEGAGYRDVEKKLPVTENTLFAIGSSSKAFTTFLIGLLVDEGKMDWDKPIRTYIPDFQLFDAYATTHCNARDMVSHRTGLPRHDLTWYGNEEDSRETMMTRLRHLKPTKELRQQFQYNNLMYMAAGYATGKVCGGSWEDAIGERIFKPLGMTRTLLAIKAMPQSDDFARGYRFDIKDDKLKPADYREVRSVAPAGSICSSAREMCQWLRVQTNRGKLGDKQIIAADTLKDMHAPHMALSAVPDDDEDSPGCYGLGWFIDTYRGEYRVHHGGAIDGFVANVTLFPRKKLGIVVLVNQSGSQLQALVTQHAADRLLAFEPRDWSGEALVKWQVAKGQLKEAMSVEKRETIRVKDTKPSRAIADFVGEYEHSGYGVISITPRDEVLHMKFHEHEFDLSHWHYDVFDICESEKSLEFSHQKVRFVSSEEGRVSGLALTLDMTLGEMVFSRRVGSKMRDPKYLAQFAGKYQIMGQVCEIALKGDTLTASLPGQPTYTLVPQADDQFAIKQLNGYGVRFGKDKAGKQTAAFVQPEGVFEATRME